MDQFFDKNGFFASSSSMSTHHTPPPPASSSSPPPAYSASVKRSSFFTMTANDLFRSPSPLFDRTSRTFFDVKHRSDTPHSLFKLKFSDSSSGYGSGNSFTSSAFHSLRRTPSLSHFSHTTTSDPLYTSSTLDRKRPPVKEKPTKAKLVMNSITNILDQIDRRVAFLKETAAELELEKKKLQKVLNSIVTCEELNAIAEVEQEEIKVTTKGLLYRLNSVDVIITTPRDHTQQKALENVNLFIAQLLANAKDSNSKDVAIAKCLSYLSACLSDDTTIKHSPQSPPDEKFQKMIIECAVDDQKMIRKTLQQIFSDLSSK